MFKNLLIFCSFFLLVACSSVNLKQESERPQTTSFFSAGQEQVAFKMVGRLDEAYIDGLMVVKKVTATDYKATVMTVMGFRVLEATITPEKITYDFLYKEVDNAIVRARVSQFLNLLVNNIGSYKKAKTKNGETLVTYQGNDAKHILYYQAGVVYPYKAQTITLLNSAELSYEEYQDFVDKPSLPKKLVYKDGKITLEMLLISMH